MVSSCVGVWVAEGAGVAGRPPRLMTDRLPLLLLHLPPEEDAMLIASLPL